ncbi:hypothetical protein OESDEN_02487 [Oesophagostomum dentatum]|uniref:Uncharacterized protein n=1 Tax=Oesophagostomum dentatum TaxID=61180 RepID=A0A0B1TQ53_OESDE|nr:hypothetical protein OESDEN_02487 [Oesophagostomum dentatum]
MRLVQNRKNLSWINEDPQYTDLTPVGAKPYTLFKSIYTNNTNRPQEYSFKTERTTESLCSISREQGYTTGAEAELTLKTPCSVQNRKNLSWINEDPQYTDLTPVGAKPYTLFKSIYTNNTNRPQEYSFKTERTTESLCSISREQGYTTGAEAELTLKTPCKFSR